MSLRTVILAAGQGKRMHSKTPKVLHALAGKSLLEHVITTSQTINSQEPPVVVYGHEGEKIKNALGHLDIVWAHQAEQLGTGHAVLQALPHLDNAEQVLILYGDVPLIKSTTLKKFIANTPNTELGILTAEFPDPRGLGRIVRDATGNISAIVEEKDANATQLALQEINSGIYLFPAAFLKKWLPTLNNKNAQQEFYLTDMITKAVEEKITIHSIQPTTYEEVTGINDRVQLAAAERFYQRTLAEKLMQQGVTLLDPARFDVRGELSVGRDTTIDINVIIEGHVKIGSHCTIGANTILRNTVIGDNVEIKPNSIVDGAEIANASTIGPFARLRPGTILAEHTHIGNFVEIKNSEIGAGSKINHLSYIGDSEVGKHVNIGAGTITCNYDGVNKHRTIIKDNAFIGSNSALVAPVIIGAGATVGAGTVVTRDAPAEQLTITRTPQRSINWQRPEKKEAK